MQAPREALVQKRHCHTSLTNLTAQHASCELHIGDVLCFLLYKKDSYGVNPDTSRSGLSKKKLQLLLLELLGPTLPLLRGGCLAEPR